MTGIYKLISLLLFIYTNIYKYYIFLIPIVIYIYIQKYIFYIMKNYNEYVKIIESAYPLKLSISSILYPDGYLNISYCST